MGGWGSGRSATRQKAEESLPLDIRKMKREGVLDPGNWFSWQWLIGGKVHSSIGARVHERYLLLHYRHRGEDTEQRIFFDWTGCNYGGRRIWFQCPDCGRRCAVFYSWGRYFSCRKCCRVIYSSQCESEIDRMLSKIEALRKKLGAVPGAYNPLPVFKPKGMHQKTYDRIRHELFILMDRENHLMANRFRFTL